MHVPDGFLDTKTLVATGALSAMGVAMAWRRVRDDVPSERIPLLGVAAAFVFAAQMINFPVAGGTSGHLVGATLVAVLLGPAAGTLIMTAVLLVQCLLFADGGFLALGANVFNMALVGVFTASVVYRLLRSFLRVGWGNIAAVAIAAWCSVMTGAICCAGELAWSGTAHWQTVFPAMAGIHAFIGIGEAVITCMVIAAITATRPDLLTPVDHNAESRASGAMLAYGLVVAVGLILFVSPFASQWPDGLDMVASTLGFSQRALHESPLPPAFFEYSIPGIASSRISGIAAGLVGAAAVLAFVAVAARLMKKRR
jgi:cobalt/nickel transport system permease protein